jgi:acetyl-CoA decarbonylase/synthase complex subunit delta
LAFDIPKQPYSGKIGEVTLGTGSGAVKVGGEEAYSFHSFEGDMPNAPKIAMEVWDYDPSEEWPPAALEPFKDVLSSPEAWAKKCVDEYGADLIVLQMKSTDPNGMDRSAEEAAEVAKKVSGAIEVPLVVWGTANSQKDEDTLKLIAEKCDGKNVSLSPVEEANHKGIGAAALGYKHLVVSSTPIDVNLAKQLNILLENLGVKSERVLIDPTTGGLGYGLEYSYSVMERIRMAALTQEDDKLQLPMINNIGNEIWRSKEAKQQIEDAPTLGDPERRGILMETVAAVCYLVAGSDIAILRHPESVRLVRSFLDLMINGGLATDIKGITKELELQEADLVVLSPEPDLAVEEAKEAAKPKAAPKKEKAPAKPKVEAKKEEKTVAAEPEAKVEVKVSADDKAKAEAKVKLEAEADAKAKTEADAAAKAKAEAEAKVKAAADAKAKAEAEAKAKVEAEAKARAEEVAKREAEEQKIREQRTKEQEERLARKASGASEKGSITAAKEQKSKQQKNISKFKKVRR